MENKYGMDDWDSPSAFNYDLLAADISKTCQGLLSLGRTSEVLSTFVVVEGLYIFSTPVIEELLDLKIFVSISPETCRQRRSNRTYDDGNGTGRIAEHSRMRTNLSEGSQWIEPAGYFDKLLWPNYLKFNGSDHADYVLDGENPYDEVFAACLQLVRNHVANTI